MGNKIRLQGHEKFALRDGWISKALKLISANKNEKINIFNSDSAPDDFGIGNNMVKSLRYWMRALGLSEEKSGKSVKLSSIGNTINEHDPYFEDIFSVWVAHANIASNFNEATTWYLFFNKFDVIDFDKEILFNGLNRELSSYGVNYSINSLKSDIGVLLSMYSKDKETDDPEDKNQSPFSQLGLVKYKDGEYIKERPDNRIINEWNVLFELTKKYKKDDSVSINDLIEGEGSIAAIYQITPTYINELLDKLDSRKMIRVNRTAGLDVIYIMTDMTCEEVMKEYYENHR
ncbi:MAG: DUF4007 family protein [Lachnospiraceae bacterium]|nr:DUF4007 family protein [Lachnospiraceae bacterium]